MCLYLAGRAVVTACSCEQHNKVGADFVQCIIFRTRLNNVTRLVYDEHYEQQISDRTNSKRVTVRGKRRSVLIWYLIYGR
jgi:hypothetical protein